MQPEHKENRKIRQPANRTAAHAEIRAAARLALAAHGRP